MKTKLLIFLLLSMAYVGCERNDAVEEQLNDILVVNGRLELNQSIDNIKLSRLNPLNSDVSQEPILAEVILKFEDNNYPLVQLKPGVYGLEDPSIVVAPKSRYELIINADDQTLHSQTLTPLEHEGFSYSKSEINTGQVGDQIDITFSESLDSDVFYLVKIIPLDENLLPAIVLNASNLSNKSTFLFNGESNTISILGTYFKYLGEHEIEVLRINEEFLPLFSGGDGENSFAESDNISNGLGTFVGTDRISIVVNVQ